MVGKMSTHGNKSAFNNKSNHKIGNNYANFAKEKWILSRVVNKT